MIDIKNKLKLGLCLINTTCAHLYTDDDVENMLLKTIDPEVTDNKKKLNIDILKLICVQTPEQINKAYNELYETWALNDEYYTQLKLECTKI